MQFCGVEGGAGRDAETVGGMLHVFTVSTVPCRFGGCMCLCGT